MVAKSTLKTFRTELFTDWKGRMSGSLSILLTVLGFVGEALKPLAESQAVWGGIQRFFVNGRLVFLITAMLALFYSSYHVWKKKNDQLLASSDTNFTGKIKELHAHHVRDEGRDVAAVVLLNVKLQNVGQASSSIAELMLEVEINGKAYIGRRISAEGMEYHPFFTSEIKLIDQLELHCMPTPTGAFERGVIHGGWAVFYIDRFTEAEIKLSRAILVVRDAFNVEHRIEGSEPWRKSGGTSIQDWRATRLSNSLYSEFGLS